MAQDLNQDYVGAGYNQRLGFGDRPALLVVDMVEAYFDKTSPLYAGVEDALESAKRVLAAARQVGVFTAFTNVRYMKGALNGGIFVKKVPTLQIFEEGSALGDWPEGLDPRDDELIISKQYPSAFFGTSLAATLTSLGIDTLIIAGLTTSGCIRATCIDTVSSGFRPIIVREAVGDRDERPHEANLFDMNAKYGDVVSETEVISYLQEIGASS